MNVSSDIIAICTLYVHYVNVHVSFALDLFDVELLDLCFTVACDKGVPLVQVLSTCLR